MEDINLKYFKINCHDCESKSVIALLNSEDDKLESMFCPICSSEVLLEDNSLKKISEDKFHELIKF